MGIHWGVGSKPDVEEAQKRPKNVPLEVSYLPGSTKSLIINRKSQEGLYTN